MDIAPLSRFQFAITTGFHYLYPPLSIGLGLILFTMIYLALFVVFFELLDHKIRRGPLPEDLTGAPEVV